MSLINLLKFFSILASHLLMIFEYSRNFKDWNVIKQDITYSNPFKPGNVFLFLFLFLFLFFVFNDAHWLLRYILISLLVFSYIHVFTPTWYFIHNYFMTFKIRFVLFCVDKWNMYVVMSGADIFIVGKIYCIVLSRPLRNNWIFYCFALTKLTNSSILCSWRVFIVCNVFSLYLYAFRDSNQYESVSSTSLVHSGLFQIFRTFPSMRNKGRIFS